MSTIVVPLDGSDLAARAIPLALCLARLTESSLILIEAIDLPAGDMAAGAIEALERGVEETLQEVAEPIRRRTGLSPSTVVKYGPAARIIVDLASAADVSAVVMATHGRTGPLRLVLGSVAEEVLRRAPVPVFLVPAQCPSPDISSLRRLLVPLDGSDLSRSVLLPVSDLARRLPAEVVVCRVYPKPAEPERDQVARATALEHEVEELKAQAHQYLSPIASDLQGQGISSRWEFGLADDSAEEVVRIAQAVGADCIALATHGRSGLDRLRYGSVAEAILRQSTVPLMTFGREALSRLNMQAVSQTQPKPQRESGPPA